MKTLAKLAVITTCLLSIYFVSKNQNPQMYDILLENVEALSAGEPGFDYCGGTGSVDCYGKKVQIFVN